jgi:polyferredoxin
MVQFAFVALNAWLGLQFYLWVRFYERGCTGFAVPRPAGAEGWLPIAGLMNFKFLLASGHIPEIHPAAMFLFMAFVAMSLVAKKSFCSWLCPVGTLSEQLARLGRRIFGRNFRLPRWLDIPLRGLKYLLLAFFLFIVGSMSAAALDEFMQTPYGLIADVKMLNFFRHMSLTAAIVVGVLVLLSFVVENVWCRYLCPYGALTGLASLLSPLKVRRNASLCSGCGHCARVCPAGLAVDKLVQVRSVECTGCMACVSSCPAEGALRFSLPGEPANGPQPRYRRPVTPLAFVGLLAFLFFGFVLFARATNHWQTNIPPALYRQLIPNADHASHPGIE